MRTGTCCNRGSGWLPKCSFIDSACFNFPSSSCSHHRRSRFLQEGGRRWRCRWSLPWSRRSPETMRNCVVVNIIRGGGRHHRRWRAVLSSRGSLFFICAAVLILPVSSLFHIRRRHCYPLSAVVPSVSHAALSCHCALTVWPAVVVVDSVHSPAPNPRPLPCDDRSPRR